MRHDSNTRSIMWHACRMAGGMRSGTGIPMSERVSRSRGSADAVESCPVRHCWVAGGVDERGVKRPGLLVEWRQRGSDWEGRVIYAAQLRPDQWSLVQEWLPASLLTPR